MILHAHTEVREARCRALYCGVPRFAWTLRSITTGLPVASGTAATRIGAQVASLKARLAA